MTSRDQQIKRTIEEITSKQVNLEGFSKKEDKMGTYLIEDVLIFSSSYDYFLLEEGGRLDSILKDQFSKIRLGNVPTVNHVDNEETCLKTVDERDIDLLIIFNEPVNDLKGFVERVREGEEFPIVFLKNEISDEGTKHFLNRNDEIFTWNGDGKVIKNIIQYMEDRLSFEGRSEGRPILLVEDSIQYCSTYIFNIYDQIFENLEDIIHEDLGNELKARRYLRRPYVMLRKNVEEGEEVYERRKDELLCIISDNRLEKEDEIVEDAGIDFGRRVLEDIPDMPVLVQSSGGLEEVDGGLELVQKNSPDLNNRIEDFVERALGPTEIEVKSERWVEPKKISSIEEFQGIIKESKGHEISNSLEEARTIDWLETLTEFELSEGLGQIMRGESGRGLKEELLNLIEEHRYMIHQGSITDFSRGKTSGRINRIGDGSIGGKARGLAFISKLFSSYIHEDIFDDLKITVPRTIVLSTDVFDRFMEENDLMDPHLVDLPDERIASKFMDASLPATVLGDVRSFIRQTRNPLIVRSSGMLEDSLTQPFAGIYSSMFLPNESWETDLRFQEVCNAIKYVYASTFFERARSYLKSTPKNVGDEKMAVILQEVVGKKHDKYFYPTISGVAKSYNHYPSEDADPEDGIVYLAIGLGKEIVEGGSSYCFNPEKPKSPMFGTPKDYIEYSQREFYALNLESVYRIVNRDEETSLAKLDLDTAEKHCILDKTASTYSHKNDRLYPGIGREGARVVDFGPIVNYESIPLARALKMLLKVAEIALGYPVEIEFAVEFEEEKAELTILQIRSMMSGEKVVDVDVGGYDEEELLCYSEDALGYGVIEDIRDVVYVSPDTFEMKNSQKAVDDLKKMNEELSEKGYILIGPGRWGTTDPWMGIPVNWGDIAGAEVIIETPTKGRSIEPSQGSHFFHDMISSDTGYMMLRDDRGELDWDWLKEQETVDGSGDVKHVRTPPMQIRIDGKEGKGVIIRKIDKEDIPNEETGVRG